MQKLLVIFLLCFGSLLHAQDKLFFKNGTSKKGIIVTNAKDYVYFKSSDTAQVEKIKKSRLVLMEDYKGTRYLFSEKESQADSVTLAQDKNSVELRNSLSVQPLAFLFGRANFSYERLSKNGKVGVVIPLILTFDPAFGNVFNAVLDSSRNSRRVKGINYITGLDINFYMGKGESVKFFLGPRVRYGTDVAFLNIEGYSVQTQFGLKVSKPGQKIVQHLSLGFGFARIISSSALQGVDPKQSFAWYSINYRLGVKW